MPEGRPNQAREPPTSHRNKGNPVRVKVRSISVVKPYPEDPLTRENPLITDFGAAKVR